MARLDALEQEVATLSAQVGQLQVRSGPFVYRAGTRLMLRGEPWTFTGINVWNANLIAEDATGVNFFPMGRNDELRTALDAMPGVDVIRAWFFQQQAVTAGVRDWSIFDRTLRICRAHGVRVIPVLNNHWKEADNAGAKTTAWYDGGYASTVYPGDTATFEDYVTEIVTRYRDDPTITFWQVMNEMESGVGGVTTLTRFTHALASQIKAIDPNHLVSPGTSGRGDNGTDGAKYQVIHASPAVDICEYHDYDKPSEPMPVIDANDGLQARLDQAVALDKPLFVGELGIHVTNEAGGSKDTRRDLLKAKFEAQFGAGVSGIVLWNWIDSSHSPGPGYAITQGDPALSLFRDF